MCQWSIDGRFADGGRSLVLCRCFCVEERVYFYVEMGSFIVRETGGEEAEDEGFSMGVQLLKKMINGGWGFQINNPEQENISNCNLVNNIQQVLIFSFFFFGFSPDVWYPHWGLG